VSTARTCSTLLAIMRVAGIDFGERRIGLAVSDPTLTLARPVETVRAGASMRETVARVALAITALARDDEAVSLVVVGLPRRLDGSPNEQTERARGFGAALSERTGLPVVFLDERLTSHEADQRLAERERDWRVRKRRLDAAAAAVILQEYLDTPRGPAGPRQEPG
jgi:putative pre-16S rRNA nuclease